MNASLGLGCWSFGGKGSAAPDDANSLRILERAAALGVTFWDTAQDYGNGHSETVIGRYLETHAGSAAVGTKTAFTASAEEVTTRVEKSLHRLKVPVIDLFTIHWPQSASDPAPMIEALEACRSRGLIRRIGVSNFSVQQMKAASRGGVLDDHQLGYSLAWRFPDEEVIPYCRSQGIGVTVYSPLAQGLLTSRGLDRDRWGADDPRRKTVFYLPEVWPRVQTAVAAMEGISRAAETLLEDLALRWVLTKPGVTRVLVGASTEQQLAANVESLVRAKENPEALEALDGLSAALCRDLPRVGNMFLHYP